MGTLTAQVLIVEDDPTVAEVLSRFLRREGYRVEVANDGLVGLQRALSDPPDLVILDLMLPGLGGLEVCRRLRAVLPVPVPAQTRKCRCSDVCSSVRAMANVANVITRYW